MEMARFTNRAIGASLPAMENRNYHPFLNPLWRRIALVAFVGAWAAYEIIVSKDQLWMMLAVGMLGYAIWTFIFQWPKDADQPDGKG